MRSQKMDYLGLQVEFCSHEALIAHLKENSKDKSLTAHDKWVYRVDGGEWLDKGKSVQEFTAFLYQHKSKEDLLLSYKTELTQKQNDQTL